MSSPTNASAHSETHTENPGKVDYDIEALTGGTNLARQISVSQGVLSYGFLCKIWEGLESCYRMSFSANASYEVRPV